MSESKKNTQYNFPEPKVMSSKMLVWSDQQIYSVYYHIYDDKKHKIFIFEKLEPACFEFLRVAN